MEPSDAWRESTYTVSQISRYLREYLESSQVLADLTVTGEIANHRQPGSGHHYFTLRDETASLNCVMFRTGRGGQYLNNGLQVVVRGRISLYTARGNLQMYVESARPAGQGALQQAFEELKARLLAEGLFDAARKRELPEYPARIAVITSPTGAVIRDIVQVLTRRYPLAEVVLIPSQVQGEWAAGELVEAFQALNEWGEADLAILARGGGSLEDLWPFNEESVARAIFSSAVPVISAVGHETDVTIADYVADVRAPTPSAAAVIASPDRSELSSRVKGAAKSMDSIMARLLNDARNMLDQADDRLRIRVPDTREPRRQIDQLLRAAGFSVLRTLEAKRADLQGLQGQLAALGPAQILARGYAIVRSENGQLVANAADVSAGDLLTITLKGGEIEAEATRTVRRPGTRGD